MLQQLNQIRILHGLLIILIYTNLVSSKQITNRDTLLYYKKSYNNILNDLRDHWQSPITYLKKRGYLPEIKNEPDLKSFNTEIGNFKIENIPQNLKKRHSSSSATKTRVKVQNALGKLGKSTANNLEVENYQGNLSKFDDKLTAVANSLTMDNDFGKLLKTDDKQTATNSLGFETYKGNLAKSDDKQPAANNLEVENYQGNSAKSDDKQEATKNSSGNQAKSNDKQSTTKTLAIHNNQENLAKSVDKQPTINRLTVENVLENLAKTDDKQSTATGFFSNMKNKFMGLFGRSFTENQSKLKQAKLLKELENDIQRELDKGTLTKNYAQKAVQTMVRKEEKYLENDLINYYDPSVIKDDNDKNA